MPLTVKDALQVNVQSQELRRDGFAVHKGQISTADILLCFGDACVRNLEKVYVTQGGRISEHRPQYRRHHSV